MGSAGDMGQSAISPLMATTLSEPGLLSLWDGRWGHSGGAAILEVPAPCMVCLDGLHDGEEYELHVKTGGAQVLLQLLKGGGSILCWFRP